METNKVVLMQEVPDWRRMYQTTWKYYDYAFFQEMTDGSIKLINNGRWFDGFVIDKNMVGIGHSDFTEDYYVIRVNPELKQVV